MRDNDKQMKKSKKMEEKTKYYFRAKEIGTQREEQTKSWEGERERLRLVLANGKKAKATMWTSASSAATSSSSSLALKCALNMRSNFDLPIRTPLSC